MGSTPPASRCSTSPTATSPSRHRARGEGRVEGARGQGRGRGQRSKAEEHADEDTGITSLKDIKAKFSGESSEQAEAEVASAEETPEAADYKDDQSEEDHESGDVPEEKPKPASSGETHEPSTDKDIGEAGSLFDL